MVLKDLLASEYLTDIPQSFHNLEITSICSDSRKVQPGSLFIALDGSQFKGEDFINDAVLKGASVVVSKAAGMQNSRVCFVHTKDPKAFLRDVASVFYSLPSSTLKCIGVTGTNGKTTTTYLLESVLKAAGHKTGVMGTVNCRVGSEIIPTKNTTPDFLEIHQFLYNLRKQNVGFCVMEVSSHGLDQGRVDLIGFDVAIFTNLTQDHLDYHPTMEDYFLAKAKLFRKLKKQGTSVINADDVYGKKLIASINGNILTYGIKNKADVTAHDIHMSIEKNQFNVTTPQGVIPIQTPLIGNFNIYNILGVVASAMALGIDLPVIQKGIESFHFTPGRLEQIFSQKGFFIFLDYAHTPDALENVLTTIKPLCKGRLICVFGCGGNRDKTKRPVMGRIAAEYADCVFVTSDNPRNEVPEDIINDILKGIKTKNYISVIDRKEAIGRAIAAAKPDDVILIAGKGHEDYQIFKDKTIEFNERKVVEGFLNDARL